MESDAGASSLLPRDDYEMFPYTSQLSSSIQGPGTPEDDWPMRLNHPTTSTAFAPQSWSYEPQVSHCDHDTYSHDDNSLRLADIHTESGHVSPRNTSTGVYLLQSQYTGMAMSDNPPVDYSSVTFEPNQDTVPSGFLMSDPCQGAARMGTTVSMPPPAFPMLSPPVVEQTLRGTQPSAKEWLSSREDIRRLYMDENCTLTSTMKTMKERYRFDASSKKYKEKLKEWGFDKNLTHRQRRFIQKKAVRRHQEEGKKTEFRVRGSLVPQKKVERTMKAAAESRSITASSPSEIAYGTPGMQSNYSAPQSPFLAQQRPISLQRNPSSLSRDTPAVNSVASALGLEWRGKGLDELRNLHRRAIEYEENGEHEEARAAFVEALCGFENLGGPGHTDTIRTLILYVRFCIAQEDFDEAKDRLQQSLAYHQAQYGNNHQLTLRSMATLGKFFRYRNQYGQSEILLVKAKIGLESLYKSDAEELYLRTYDVISNLTEVLIRQGNVEGAEQELLSLISKLEALQRPQLEHPQGPYHAQLSRQQGRLACLYIGQWKAYAYPPTRDPPYLKVEQWLLNLTETCQLSAGTAREYWSNYQLLQCHYFESKDDLKLQSILATTEDKIKIAGDAAWPYPVPACRDRPNAVFFSLKEGVICSYLRLENYERAEWWTTRIKNDVEAHFGADSQEALLNIIRIALLHLRNNHWDIAKPMFQEALRRAETVPEPDNPIREKIAKCLVDHEYESSCYICKIPCQTHPYSSYFLNP